MENSGTNKNFQKLNLRPNATHTEIRTAFRALAKKYHPDSSSSVEPNPRRFQEISEAYRSLIAGLDFSDSNAINKASNNGGSASPTSFYSDWRFKGVYQDRLDEVYIIKAAHPAHGQALKLSLPWKKETACPNCLGLGYTFERSADGGFFNKIPCTRCEGMGVIKSNAILDLTIPYENIIKGEYRVHGRGHYFPTTAERGDLVLKFELEAMNSTGKSGLYNA